MEARRVCVPPGLKRLAVANYSSFVSGSNKLIITCYTLSSPHCFLENFVVPNNERLFHERVNGTKERVHVRS